MKKRPRIGVTNPEVGGFSAWIMTWFALRRVGADAVRLSTDKNFDINDFDGFVMGGGSDIDPENYGEELREVIKDDEGHTSISGRIFGVLLLLLRFVSGIRIGQLHVDRARDEMESRICRHAIDMKLPLLGICRGAQMINIVLGGDLHRDISGFYIETPQIRSVLPRKKVFIKGRSRLREILNVESCTVNALHNQAVKNLGRDLIISALEKGDVVQGMESTTHPFLIGVQWHPEYLPQKRIQQRLFKALARAAKQRAENR